MVEGERPSLSAISLMVRPWCHSARAPAGSTLARCPAASWLARRQFCTVEADLP
jgi:hypothetical protein